MAKFNYKLYKKLEENPVPNLAIWKRMGYNSGQAFSIARKRYLEQFPKGPPPPISNAEVMQAAANKLIDHINIDKLTAETLDYVNCEFGSLVEKTGRWLLKDIENWDANSKQRALSDILSLGKQNKDE